MIAFEEEKVMAADPKPIADPGVGGLEKVTTEQLRDGITW